jgi:hypothetical protein
LLLVTVLVPVQFGHNYFEAMPSQDSISVTAMGIYMLVRLMDCSDMGPIQRNQTQSSQLAYLISIRGFFYQVFGHQSSSRTQYMITTQ